MEDKDSSLLNNKIVGRVEPHIYAFTTETIPNYLKIGDTYRPVEDRITEWKKRYRNLKHIYTESARIDNDTIFRDYSIHQFLEIEKSLKRLTPQDLKEISQKSQSEDNKIYYSNEFFENATVSDIDEAIKDIHSSAENNDGRYKLLTSDHLPKDPVYIRNKTYKPRDNQKEAVESFMKAFHADRKNLLMYAVMRFGKTYTSMLCARSMGANLILVISGKVNIRNEWQKTIQSIIGFEDFVFATKVQLKSCKTYIKDKLNEGKKVVLFLSLQDLQGDEKKEAHDEVFSNIWDLVIVDETHFGAWARNYGKILENKGKTLTKKQKEEIKAEYKRQMKGVDKIEDLEAGIKDLKRNITLHLSGTPYRILMENKFAKEDIIAYIQQTDIVKAQQKWIEENKYNDNVSEWDNPYYGFPQLIRFAFNPNNASIERINQLKAAGATTSFSELFRPKSLTKQNDQSHREFIHEDVVLDFLKVVDGSKNDSNVLGFLDNERIKSGKLCSHMVMVLPYCASCDAMKSLIHSHQKSFKNLGDYEIINISGVDRPKIYSDPDNVIDFIAKCAAKGKKTITLTVNRMLTGNTVPQWDTMLYLKESSSPEEYDQAVFRLQNPYIDEYIFTESYDSDSEEDKRERIVKFNMKPQTILVDFNPDRMFRLQERKSLIFNINKEQIGNNLLKKRIDDELKISPIIVLDHNKLREISSTDIMDAVREYASTRSIIEEAGEIPVDELIIRNPELNKFIQTLNPIDAKKGLKSKANKTAKDDKGSSTDAYIYDENSEDPSQDNSTSQDPGSENELSLTKRIATLYTYILFFAYLTNDRVSSLQDIIDVIDNSEDNIRIARNLGIEKNLLKALQHIINGNVLCFLDRKIHNINDLINDPDKTPQQIIDLALTKFTRLSETEIVTPARIADEMVEKIPENLANKGNILDIASKQGEFAMALHRRFGNGIADRIYSVCTSPVAYEFTRKLYNLLSLPIDHIVMDFYSNHLIIPSHPGVKKFLRDVSFDIVVGNPPYNETTADTSDKPIYHLFIDFAAEIAQYNTLITPARFLFNAGKTPKEWNKNQLQDPHLTVIKYSPQSSDIFPDISLPGGIGITLRNKKVFFGAIRHFTPHKELRGILSKVSKKGEASIWDIIYPQNKFNLTNLFNTFPEIKSKIGSNGKEKRLTTSIFTLNEVFTDENISGSQVLIYGLKGLKRTGKWIAPQLLQNHPNTDKWKVILPKSNGAGALGAVIPTLMIGVPFVAGPQVGITQSFITFGAFDTQNEAEACLKYIKTKFARVLLGIHKVTQDNPIQKWEFIPMQDFSKQSDVPWDKSIKEIDEYLYKKYGLSPEEKDFINLMIKDMK